MESGGLATNTDETTYVFCYGSNHPEQVSRRIGITIEDILSRSIACSLPGYKRVYIGVSRTWQGKSVANIMEHENSEVIGYAFKATSEEISKLDTFEGYPTWYTRIPIKLKILEA